MILLVLRLFNAALSAPARPKHGQRSASAVQREREWDRYDQDSDGKLMLQNIYMIAGVDSVIILIILLLFFFLAWGKKWKRHPRGSLRAARGRICFTGTEVHLVCRSWKGTVEDEFPFRKVGCCCIYIYISHGEQASLLAMACKI